ncbi:P-loop ATPase, Sll1717 family [Planktotalea arctica]|uniref:P-loop ATPase, Sll1717 family n=1 Tax=Planktotalea arctica TaxID=1481893 RepID=UPI00111C69CC|nr:ATP-binding protein [Planktotalea arctica]
MSNPIIFNASSRIGKISAEADEEFLFECFVDIDALAELKEIGSPKMILLGSTGTGKTALIRKIEFDYQRANFIQLDEMALDYLGNSDVIQFLLSIDVNLDLFFQALWKHVILIEFIRLKFNIQDEQKSKFVFSQIFDAFGNDQRKKRGLDYLRKWESKFWISMDENIREITENLETIVNAEMGGEIEKFNAKAGYARTLSAEKKSQLQRVARKFVAPELLTDLAKVVDTLSEHGTRVEPCFILIDSLDENWIDISIKYPLIRALIESLKSLRRVPDLKTVVALRSDLLEKVILETRDAGFQSEKYEDYIIRLKWDSSSLKKLVNKRINFLFRRKYNRQNVMFEDIFPEKISNVGSPFTTLLEKSLYRPRDLINFVNMCLEASEGSTAISRKTFTQAERTYSANRLTAMIEEWQHVVANAGPLINLLKGKRGTIMLSEFCTSRLLDDLVHHFPEAKYREKDELWRLVEDATTRNVEPFDLACALIERLHLMGAIGVKYDPNLPYQYFFQTQKPLPTNYLDSATKIRVHPMLHSALGIVN